MKSTLIAGFENFMRKIVPQISDETLVAGVSGGADSVCLLKLLHSYAEKHSCRLVCIHVNHGIRGEEADRDEKFVKELCERLGSIVFEAFHENIPEYAEKKGLTLEEAGRNRRYEIFAEVCERYGSRRLFVAHNQRDRAETVLFNLFRGSSVAGICGIRDISVLSAGHGKDKTEEKIGLYRPLIDIDRPEIEEYLRENGMTWCTDSTNLSDEYTRNRIRRLIMPEAERINAGAVRHITAASEDVAELNDFFMAEADRLFGEKYDEKSAVLSLSGFGELMPIMRRELVYRLICAASGRKKDITRKHVAAGVELALGESGKKINLPYGITLKKEYDRLCAGAGKEESMSLAVVELDLAKPEAVYYSGEYAFEVRIYEKAGSGFDFKDKSRVYFDFDRILSLGNGIVLRPAEACDWFSPFTDGRKKSLSRFFIDEKLDSEARKKMPVVACGDRVLWIPCYRNDEGFRIDENTERVLEIRRKYNG